MELTDEIGKLKGIGPKTSEMYAKLNIFTIDDLIHFYPREYELFEKPRAYNPDASGQIISVYGKVQASPALAGFNGRSVVSCRFIDPYNNVFLAKWYNQPFLKSTLKTGSSYVLKGKLVFKRGLFIEQPQIFSKEKYMDMSDKMIPIYPLTKGLTRNSVIKNIKASLEILETDACLKDEVSGKLEKVYKLFDYKKAILNIHFPKNDRYYLDARKRLVFGEVYTFLKNISELKSNLQKLTNDYRYERKTETDEFIKKIPFELTNDQIKAIETIRAEMSGTGVMHRLLQGDVGAGKTIVAFTVIIENALNNNQSAFMAPTEVLARQHYNSFVGLINASGLNITTALLTGSLKKSEKDSLLRDISEGRVDVVIGTHALFQEKVSYKRLSLVITDEQHRFGVAQRNMLSEKGNHPHCLYMSATPIPRSLAGIIYADMDVSVLAEKPKKRLHIKSCVVGKDYRDKAYSFIKNELENGRQAIVICPLIEDSELSQGENVKDYSERLASIFAPRPVSVLHGRMSAEEKKNIMTDFSDGKISLLVSTTVIEVGVDVPNATVIMIEDAQRFGLAQLHQLRGRVGRGVYQSYCIFVDTSGEKDNKRLQVLNKSEDGFFIAEEDLRLRGPGDLFGIKQSGEINFKLTDIYRDAETIKLVYDFFKNSRRE